MMRLSLIVASLLGLAFPGNCFAAETPNGLYVRDGILMRAGQPYRGVGVNYFSLFSRLIEVEKDESSLRSLKQLSKAGVPFVRFMAGGFWPRDWHLYQTNPDEYFRRFDRVVRAAEDAHIGLIPSLFWHYPTVPDLVGEPVDQLGNPDSKTTAFIRRYTEEIVSRYKGSPAIYAWEFGNEYTLAADLPNAATQRPQIVPELGTPRTRRARDELTSQAAIQACSIFAKEVRRHDATRPIISGNALPRISAWHNTREKSWKADSAAQFQEILLRDNPDPLGCLSVHVYPPADGKFPAPARNIAESIHALAQVSRESHKPLFIGEFGAIQKGNDLAGQRSAVEEILRSIEIEKVPLAALWVFDLKDQDATLNVTFDGARKDFLDLIVKTNVRLSKID